MIENNELGRSVRTYFIAMEKQARANEQAPEEITPGQRIAIHKQLTLQLKAIRSEQSEPVSAIQYAQIKQLCNALDIPAPAYLELAHPSIRKGELFLVHRG